MSRKFNKVFYRTWEFDFSLLCLVTFSFVVTKGIFGVFDFIQFALGLYVSYLAFFKPRSWIKKTWQLYLVISFIVSWTIISFFVL
ncbi:TPA: hypothetical protein ACGOXV_001109 [Streptococcus suis]|nr:hypothetical protein [Streptococcus suis]NQK45248.1 hypothetical protein [Streptococcus suis]